ncbi:diguanylate cyclase [Psychromonas ingrahamii 37]|uniref:Diguanylate cyclase n=1 Tax=Psychromonas ingrahamii (strain DSM 17664 / CCUG 51855 / 37) TaxID=357804 RepID=A1SZ61_PSYIN|nr:diguanylate cyclase [Psychromonas ingrahamii]ABM04776.1 diguanylate cyclase [Psychromonas ingrahamii 37]
MSLRTKLSLLLVFLFVFSIGNTLFTFVLDKFGEEKLGWVIHTHEVLNSAQKLLSSMTDAETGQRGFLLTGNPDYLAPYLKGILSSEQSFNNLSGLTSDNPKQTKRLNDIKAFMEKKFIELKLTIELYQSGNTEDKRKAIEIVEQNTGKKMMDEIRLQITLFTNHEHLLLERRKADFRESRAQLTTIVIIELILFVFLGIITMFFIRERLFSPLKLLLLNAEKMERGERQNIEDILPKDEMGYLLSRFYQVSEKIYTDTEILTYEATHDALTGLANRVGIDIAIRHSIAAIAGSDRKMAVLFIDLNKFKKLNDTLGHDAGDAVLKETANRLKEALRSDDKAFRLGGDEFVIALNDLSEISHIKIVVDNILDKFKSPFIFNNDPIEISLSIGIAIAPDNSTDSEAILKFSDIAMYMAKHNKNHNYSFSDKTMLKRENDK